MNGTNKYYLNNTTSEVQAAINTAIDMLVANKAAIGQQIVATGDGRVKFVTPISSIPGDAYINITLNQNTGFLTFSLNMDALQAGLAEGDGGLEITKNKVSTLSRAVAEDLDAYPNAKAVIDYVDSTVIAAINEDY